MGVYAFQIMTVLLVKERFIPTIAIWLGLSRLVFNSQFLEIQNVINWWNDSEKLGQWHILDKDLSPKFSFLSRFSQFQLASDAGRVYSTPWDAEKQLGCVCDLGQRGPDCSLCKLCSALYVIFFVVMNMFFWLISFYTCAVLDWFRFVLVIYNPLPSCSLLSTHHHHHLCKLATIIFMYSNRIVYVLCWYSFISNKSLNFLVY
jgi:hypothetical protein